MIICLLPGGKWIESLGIKIDYRNSLLIEVPRICGAWALILASKLTAYAAWLWAVACYTNPLYSEQLLDGL